MEKQIVIYPYHEILLNTKRNKVLICSTTWMNIKNIYAKWTKVKHKGLHTMIPFIWNSRKGKPIVTDSKSAVALGPGAGGVDWLQRGTRELFRVMEIVYLDHGNGYTTIHNYLNSLNCTLTILSCVKCTSVKWFF